MDYRLELFDKLNQQHHITYIFTNQGRGQSEIKENHLNIPQEWDYKIVRRDKLKINGREIITYFNLIRELRKKKYDIVITSTSWYICYPISKVTGKKFIILTEYWHWSGDSLSRKILNLTTKFILRHADAVITTGKKSHEEHLRLGVHERKIFECIQCSSDYSKLQIKDLRTELLLSNKKIILYISRISPVKGLDYLIQAFSLLEIEVDVSLVILGDGPFKKECENLVRELDLKNVFFIGAVHDNVVKASYYKMCDVFVLPSIYFDDLYEPWGLVVNEAMAFGKPIVTTDAVGSAYDMIYNDFNGYIVKNKDIKELYNALYKILSDSELAKTMGQNSKKIFMEKNKISNMTNAITGAINYVQNKSR